MKDKVNNNINNTIFESIIDTRGISKSITEEEIIHNVKILFENQTRIVAQKQTIQTIGSQF